MKNNYWITGDIAIIEVISKEKSYNYTIDAEDLERVQELGYSLGKATRDYGTFKVRQRNHYLHRFITGAAEGDVVDHIDGNKFNNRKSNLRVTSLAVNNRNENNKYKLGVSGYRNVHWDKQRGKWVVKLTVNNKTKNCGGFSVLEEAVEHAKNMREFYWGADR